MKKTTLFLTAVATLCLTVSTLAQNVPSYVPTNGLIGWWPFNGNANDESGNGNNGTVNGANLDTDRFSNVNSAFSFNGINSNIIVPDNAILNSAFVSISVWVKTNNNLSQCIIYKTDAAAINEQFACLLNYPLTPNDNINWSLKNGGNCSNPGIGWQVLNPSSTVLVNSWHHLVFTYNGSISEIYLDKIKINSDTFLTSIMDQCGGAINIGKGYNANYHFNGLIDDIGIWDRALTQQEITDLYNSNLCYQTITVTDTLLINMGITGFNPVTYSNTIKIFPNPSNDHLTIDYGNFASLNGYQLNIENSLGQQVFQTNITQQSDYLSLSTWGGNGLYFVHIIDPQGNTIDIRKIILQ